MATISRWFQLVNGTKDRCIALRLEEDSYTICDMDKTGKYSDLSRVVLAAAGFFVSLGALAWLNLFLGRPHEIIPRLGWISAMLCAQAALMFCLGTMVAFVARRRNWSPRECAIVGHCFFLVPGVLIFFFADPQLSYAGGFLATNAFLAGYISRKLAFPELTEEEATAPTPPLSLFPK
jgi:hypothetical protein